MRRFEARETASRLIVAPPSLNAIVDWGVLILFFVVAEPVLIWILARIDDGSYPTGTVILLLITYLVTAIAAFTFLVMLREYRRAHPGKSLILDRRSDTVTLGDERLCVLSEVACVELRCIGRPNESPSYRVGLVIAGLRASAAPRVAPSVFDDTILVNESIDARAMRAYAARIAAFIGLPVEEVGL
jgi:hypothetical protein